MKVDKIVELWLDAEEENRKHTSEGNKKCLELKDKVTKEYNKLSKKEKQEVDDILDSYAA